MKPNGFSLIEVIVSLGLIGGISLFILDQQKTASNIQKKVSYNQEINSYVNQIQTMLSNRANCSVTTYNKSVGDELDEIKFGIVNSIDPDGDRPFLPDDSKIGIKKNINLNNSEVQISSIKLLNKSNESGATLDSIRVGFRIGKNGPHGEFIPKQVLGGNGITRDFFINGIKDTTGKFKSCYSETGNVVKTAIQAACESLDAEWDSQLNKCILTNIPICIISQGECGDRYREVEVFKWDVKISDRKNCTQVYSSDLGLSSVTRNRLCAGSTGLNCDSSLFGPIDGYSRREFNCTNDPELRELSAKKCCRREMIYPGINENDQSR